VQPLPVVVALESLLASPLEVLTSVSLLESLASASPLDVSVFSSVFVALVFVSLLREPASASLRAGKTRNRFFEEIANIQDVSDDISGRIY
jgi:hypothetical protein